MPTASGVTKDVGEANRWFRKAADAGDTYAMRFLANNLKTGNGIAQDDAAALAWYRKAVDNGDAGAMTDVGIMLDQGRGTARNPTEAVSWYRRAAQADDRDGMMMLAMHLQTSAVRRPARKRPCPGFAVRPRRARRSQ